MRAMVIIVVIAVGLGGILWGYQALWGEEEVGDFVTKPLERGDIVKSVSATGTIEPLIKVIVGSQVSGRIKKWHADFNAVVKESEVLAEIEPNRFRSAFDQATAELALSQAKVEETHVRYRDAERERKRIQALLEKYNASENEYLVAQAMEDAAKAAWHGAQAGVMSAEASVSQTKIDLDRTIILSPISGVVISRNIEDGQTVAASLQSPELFIIANDLKRMQVNANVSEADIGLIREGAPARFRVDAYPDRTFAGTILQIRYNPTVLDNVVTYVTLIEVNNDDLLLRPGMTANVTFEVAKVVNVVRIPNAALRFDPNPPESPERPQPRRGAAKKPTIYVLQNGQPQKKEVEIGLTDGTWSELKGGDAQEGLTVIVEKNWQGNSGNPNRRVDPSRTMRRI